MFEMQRAVRACSKCSERYAHAVGQPGDAPPQGRMLCKFVRSTTGQRLDTFPILGPKAPFR
uniref:Uncharacterized protein n=1 Tax=Anguilla anguilla TaxID=7936 RepID=A0A0E9V2Z3_ANGAN